MTITPDSKDWTWVLRRPCPECGVDVSTLRPGDTGAHTRAVATAWSGLLRAPVRGAGTSGGALAERPAPQRWSTLEYACHVRDVLRIFDVRLDLMLREDDPLFPNWDQDATAVTERYGDQDPLVVATELEVAGAALADRFDSVAGDQWSRRGRRSDGADFDVTAFARYFLHDPLHHLWDVGAPLPLSAR
jgi:hypothetical protein